MSWVVLLLVAAGVYRVSRMLTQEDGPFDAFSRVRAWMGQGSWVGRGVHCYMCVSFWLAGLAAVLLVLSGRAAWADLWLVWPGIAGAAVVIYQGFR